MAADAATLQNPVTASYLGASITNSAIGSNGATGAQVQEALDEGGLSITGAGIKVGVLSDSFNDLGGAAADEADGALPTASNIQVLSDLSSGGTDEGRAMMQIVHDIAPSASLAFYTAYGSEQDFANGILALAAAGCKVICDDVSYFDEPFFQNGVVAQAIQTVEAEGVTYVTAAGNDAENGYQATWTPTSGSFDGTRLSDAESFGGSLVQTITVSTDATDTVPLLLEWNQAYGEASSDVEILVFHNGALYGTATNVSSGESTNPWADFTFTASGTYQIAIENLSGPNPGLIKEIAEGDGQPVTISDANAGTVYGHAMTPGAITAGAVDTADTPAFGVDTPTSESFSSSGAGTELLFANNGTALTSPDLLSPVAVSGVDNINTTVSDLTDFYGTSAATASLAGVAALILSANPNLTPAQVTQIMEQTALPMAESAVSGSGLVQVDPAVALAQSIAEGVIANSPFQGNPGWTVVGVGDFTDNGIDDLVYYGAVSGITQIEYLNGTSNSGGGYIANSPFEGNPGWTVVGAGDFTGNGFDDLVYYDAYSGLTQIEYLNGTGNVGGGYIANSPFEGNPGWTVVGAGDFTGNGKDDLVYYDAYSGLTVIEYLNGNNNVGGGLIANSPFEGNPGWTVVGTGDFTGNGFDDLVYYDANSGLTQIEYLNGNSNAGGGYVANSPFEGNPGWTVVGVGDFTGNGKDDLVYYDAYSGLTEIEYLNGNNNVGGGLIANSPFQDNPAWRVVGVGDFTGSGIDDLAYYNAGTGTTALVLMNGTTTAGGQPVASHLVLGAPT